MLMYASVYVIIAVLTVSAIETVYCNISGKLCLQNALEFLTKYSDQCDYLENEDEGKKLEYEMDTDTEHCRLTCDMEMKNLECDNLLMITLVFNNYHSSKAIICSGHHSKRSMHLFINCHEHFTVRTSEQCDNEDKSSQCVLWQNICICHCDSEYIMVNGHCVKESVLLNHTCEINAQCMGTPYATCRRGVCSCIEGYTPTTSSESVLNLQGPSQAESRVENTDVRGSDVGLIIGVLLGGLCLGALITTGIAFLIFKRSQFTSGKREEPNVVFEDNKGYSVINVEINGGEEVPSYLSVQQKASSSSTYNNSKEIPEYSNHLGNAKKRDVYNHLNEKDDSVDDNTYDNASPAIGHERNSNDYSSVDDMEKKTAVSDNYFTLEKN